MDKCTHDVRRANWLNIINQCQERPANVTVHFRQLLTRLQLSGMVISFSKYQTMFQMLC